MNTCLYANDIDDYACKVYAKNWNDGTLHKEDIKNVTKDDVCRRGIPDVICGGVPCQDVSLAGKGEGLKEGNRTGLWFEMLRLVSEIRPRYAIVENVPGLVNRGLNIILGTLSEIGYDAEWEIISASAFGAPHQRDRIFVVAYPECQPGRTGSTEQGSIFGLCEKWNALCESDRSSEMGIATDSNGIRCEPRSDTKREHEHNMAKVRKTSENQQSGSKRKCRTDTVCETIADTDMQRCQEQRFAIQNESEYDPVGRDRWWEAEPCVDRVANGIPFELDCVRRLDNEKSNNQKTITKKNKIIYKLLCAMWQYRKLAKTSPELYIKRLYSVVPEMPYRTSQIRWFMGEWDQEDKELCHLWECFYSTSFKEAQDLQCELLERIRKIERMQTLACNNTISHRLKCLGNAIVPQVSQFVGECIMQHLGREFTFAELFAGIGGFRLGFERSQL